MRLATENLTWGVDGRAIVRDVTVEIGAGETVGLIGPNGCGKSSLLRCIAGLRAPSSGVVRHDGEDISGWDARRVAQRLAFVEQAAESDSDLRVGDVVSLGRTPFRDRWRGLSAADHAIVDAALEHVDLTGLRDRHWNTLSGGERQRAHIGRALAQRPWAILLDEPTNHLDIRHQLDLMELLASSDQTVLVALHDLAMAARYCDRLVLLSDGAVVADGTPEEVLTGERLREVYEVDACVGRDVLGHLSISYRVEAR
ncbi:ABC transporter ATP-binding protein [Actinokineospora fastidiosa]|uniref:Sugar ABC transporter substrate-binding protein n=1 Tax=Actinokineospora fastidiosa TaxID=1816 RepID=A0A918GGA9_9PSEU|nr:ABC transporter ATP-binding protein [Actinokineospora fastidiosa]GGS35758.1 sugar ABC transporter substrate-binding protein [Actinokineospora fastidiosa]